MLILLIAWLQNFSASRRHFELICVCASMARLALGRATRQDYASEKMVVWFQMVRSIWLPTNAALGLSLACGVAGSALTAWSLDFISSGRSSLLAGLTCVGCQLTALISLRQHEEYELTDDTVADRRAVPLGLFCLPGLVLCSVGMWLCSLLLQ